MTDTLTKAQRSERMSRVRNRDSKPELAVRRIVHGMGYRYRLHSPKLPGKPDMAFNARKKVIFVHGCFWHRHKNCKLARMPKSRLEFWKPKLDGNRERDMKTQQELESIGWKYLVIWECETENEHQVRETVGEYLG